MLNYHEALKIVGGLSHPDKMPWYAWSISAEHCKTGAKLAQIEGTTCNSCYALKGRYMFPNVKEAQNRRLEATSHPKWVEAFALVLNSLHSRTRKVKSNGERENRFRWFDAGDLQSFEMLVAINEIARLTPQIDHWLPTREFFIVDQFLSVHGAFVDNLVVRMSTAKVGIRPQWAPGVGNKTSFSTVGVNDATDIWQCEAKEKQRNRCLECNKCWTNANVNYPLH